MKACLFVVLVLLPLAKQSDAQSRVRASGGEVTRSSLPRPEVSRLAGRIPGIEADRRERVQVSGDSAQRIAMNDFAWKGRVSSVEIDEEDSRIFWDVKIVP